MLTNPQNCPPNNPPQPLTRPAIPARLFNAIEANTRSDIPGSREPRRNAYWACIPSQPSTALTAIMVTLKVFLCLHAEQSNATTM